MSTQSNQQQSWGWDGGGNYTPPTKAKVKAWKGALNTNPCIGLYGVGPEGATCRTCTHLFAREFAKTYYKCDLRDTSSSPSTDHRVRWSACGRYESEAKEDKDQLVEVNELIICRAIQPGEEGWEEGFST